MELPPWAERVAASCPPPQSLQRLMEWINVMPNAKTPHSIAVRKAATQRSIERQVQEGARRLGVLLPAATAAKLQRLQDARRQSARRIIIDLIEQAGE